MAILLAIFVSAPAFAQDEPTFQELIGDAKTAFEAEDYQKAIDLLLYAHRVQPNARLLINVAKSYEKMDQCASALVYYKAYLREDSTEDSLVDVATDAVDGAGDCDGYDESMSGRLIIKSTPRGAKIAVDGKEVGVTPFEVAGLNAGAHTVTLTLEGYDPYEEAVDLKPNADANVAASLKEKTEEVVTTPDPNPDPDPIVKKKDEGMNPMVYVAGGIAAVGVGLFVYGLIQDVSVIPGIDDERSQYAVDSQEYADLTDDRSSAATMALVGYIGGSLLALGGGGWLVYMLFLDQPEEARPVVDLGNGVDLRPVIRHDGAGVILEGRF